MMVQYQMEHNHHLDMSYVDVNEMDFVLVEMMDHMNMNHNNYRNVARRKKNDDSVFLFHKTILTRGA
jgi:hypothetical protein